MVLGLILTSKFGGSLKWIKLIKKELDDGHKQCEIYQQNGQKDSIGFGGGSRTHH